MSVFSKIVVLWHDAPLPLRRWLVPSPLAPSRRKLVNRVRLSQLEIFEIRDPLPSHRVRMHWQTQKAFVFGTYEREVTRAIQRSVQPGWTVVDIGAHIGYHTLLLVKLVGPAGKGLRVRADGGELPGAPGEYGPQRIRECGPAEEGGHGSPLPGDDGPEQ
jgi:hypothetical protein